MDENLLKQVLEKIAQPEKDKIIKGLEEIEPEIWRRIQVSHSDFQATSPLC